MINLRNLGNCTVVVAGNTFTNLSLTGALINFEGLPDVRTQKLLILRNSFNLIHSYLGPTIIKVERYFTDNITKESDTTLAYAQYGGSFLLQGNSFSEIGGCPAVETGLILMGVVD